MTDRNCQLHQGPCPMCGQGTMPRRPSHCGHVWHACETSLPGAVSDDNRTLLPFEKLSDTGVLWLINKAVFHPRGFALAVTQDKNGEIVGWGMMGDGSEPWHFAPETDDECFAKVEAFLATFRKRTDG